MKVALLSELDQLLPNCFRQDRVRLRAKAERRLAHAGPGMEEDLTQLLDEARQCVARRHRRYERLPQVTYPLSLPITTRKDEIVAAIRAHPVVIIVGETGSGKTTQIPKMCLEAGLGTEGKIGCTQPRRVAALSISRRIAEELKVKWGEEVGCKIRFADRSNPSTYIKLMTDGILLAETQGDPDLNEYDAIVVDEAHERSLNIDFLLGHLKLLLSRRPDLKLIITSATIDAETFSRAFGNAPVLEVSGRTYPVEIRYAPHDAEAEETGDLTYIDAAVRAVEDVLLESNQGDILVFMPTERDIRETQDDLVGRFANEAEIVPLFGRLTAGEQERVFAPSPRRKIIVATNIAETSLTIPGVHYVVDTGLARVSRYSPRTRTKRLPIEPISQSSAKQRAGRCGRVENGICIRLYSEEDFAARPKDTQPEIQRANLAEVILKMKAWRLGEMESFPFLNPPQPQAVQNGYQLLQELGALDEDRNLLPLGRDLARLPVDPAIGRMILEAGREGALQEVLVIAAGLSIQDPRERPLDRQDAADQAHRQFLDPNSDFLTLLNIWNAYDARLEALPTQNQMRKFCRANFISYTRMREWIDVHAQLEDALETLRTLEGRGHEAGPVSIERPRKAVSPLEDPRYRAIHRSILAGLLGHIAQRTERNLFKASANRQLMAWPGSSLFDRGAKPNGGPAERTRGNPAGAAQKSSQPAWIVAGELVETSRLFARTVAGVSADWIAQLGAHVSKRSYGGPYWDRRTGRVLARERITLFGLEVLERLVDFGRVQPEIATEIFIRSALIEGDLESPHRFLAHNQQLRQKLEVWRTHSREFRLPNTEEALFAFYARQLRNVSSVHDLNRVVREQGRGNPGFLCATEADFTGGEELKWDTSAFPNAVLLDNQSAALEYAYAPGEEHDGITVKMPVGLAQRLDPALLDWAVPGLRQQQIEFLLKSLPKALRVPLMPLPVKARELAGLVESETGLDGLRELIREKYGVSIPADAWKRELLPNHLRPRVAITTTQGEKVIAAGRDLEALRANLAGHETPVEQAAWAQSVQRWERYDLKDWSFADPPEQIEVSEISGTTLCAFPGLERDENGVHLKLFRNRSAAAVATEQGFARLAEMVLGKELAWLQKDLRALEKMKDLFVGFAPVEEFTASAFKLLRRHLIPGPEPVLPLRKAQFQAAVDRARSQLPGLIPRLLEILTQVLRLRQQVLQHKSIAPGPAPRVGVLTDLRQLGTQRAAQATAAPLGYLRAELDALVPPDFLERVPFEQLTHWPRYLKALLVRADRASLNPLKDVEKAKLVQPFVAAWQELNARRDLPNDTRRRLDDFRWAIEELKVSIFAQELGTAQPVSPKRLEALLQSIREGKD